ncbi:MAG: signal peptidase I [Sarcina sp.]
MIRRLVNILIYSFVILLIIFFVLSIDSNLKLNILGPYKVYNVLTGSMNPNIPKGSLVIVKEVTDKDINVNDVITYRGKNSNAIITHRVVEISNDKYITKGDANETRDTHPVELRRVLGKTIYHIPYLGMIAFALRQNIFLVVGVFIVLYVAYIFLMRSRS